MRRALRGTRHRADGRARRARPARETSRSARGTPATRSPRSSPRATTPRRTPPPTRRRRCCTAWRCRPARERCSGWRRGAGGWCGRCWRVTREEVRDYLRGRGLEWREDPSNADRRFARARVRHDVLDALRELSPAVERTIAETARQLRDEAEVLDAAVERRAEASCGGGPRDRTRRAARAPARAAAARPAGARRAGGRRPPGRAQRCRGARPTRSWRWASAARSRSTWAAGCGPSPSTGRSASRARGDAEPPAPVELAVPGRARFGDWELEARLGGPGDVAVRDLGPGRDRPRVARRRPHAPAGLGGIEVAPGPVHGPQGPARAAPHPAGGRVGRRDRLGGRGGGRRALRGGGGRRRARWPSSARSA